MQSLIRILFKPKLKLRRKNLKDYDYSYDVLIICFAFSLIFASFFSANLNYSIPNDDKPDKELIRDFENKLKDTIDDSGTQTSSNTVTVSDKIPSPVENVGVSTKP